MEVPEIAQEIYEVAHTIRNYAVLYQDRKDTGRATNQKKKMILRRIQLLEGWITNLKYKLKEEA